MASSINASTSGAGGIITTADNTGTLQLQSGGTTIATISSTGLSTQVGAPAFSAYSNTTQSISNITWTKVQFNIEEFDTNSNYDNSTNYRFTPTVAGYYQINAAAYISSLAGYQIVATIYKNGTMIKKGSFIYGASGDTSGVVSALVYLNGSTDYIEIYCFQNSGTSKTIYGDVSSTYFQAAMIRSA